MSNIMKLSLAIGISVSLVANSYAQPTGTTDPVVAPGASSYANKSWAPSQLPDGVIDRVPHDYKVQPWRSIREIDVAWYHRVWKIIPVHEKQNQAFLFKGDEYTNGGAFIEILNHAVLTGEMAAFAGIDEGFTAPLKPEDLKGRISGGVDTIPVEDPETGEIEYTIREREFNIESVTKYLVKEDWIFDRNMGRLQKRIIGIAPLKDELDEFGNLKYVTALYWVHYPTAREVLGKYEVYNPLNMVKRMTWADYLEGGYYSSYVQKYSKNNPTGEAIMSMNREQNLRGLIEGEEVIMDLLNQEQDMWER